MCLTGSEEPTMSQQRSLRVNDPVFAEFNRLKIRLAVSRDNRISTVSDIVSAMLSVSEKHYDELVAALVAESGNT